MDGDDNLSGALRALAAETSREEVSPGVREALRAELKARARRRQLTMWWPAAAVALLALGVWLGQPRASAPPVQPLAREATPPVAVEEPVRPAVIE